MVMMERSVSKKKVRKGQGSRASQGSTSRSVDSASRASSSTSLTSSQSTLQSQSGEFDGTGLDLAALTGGYDLRAHLRQILTFSDDENDDSSEDEFSLESYDEDDMGNDEDEELQKLMSNDRVANNQPPTPKPTDQNNSQALVPITEEDDIDSEEERELLKEIKDEITNNVRGEMKSELELYKYKMQKLENEADGKAGPSGEGKNNKHSDLDNLEPKLRDAIIKMRKLDRILMKKIRKEKEVKRDRILLERRIRREIEGLHEEGKDEYKEVKTNEQKFLALELPSRHNEEKMRESFYNDKPETRSNKNQSDKAHKKHKRRHRKSKKHSLTSSDKTKVSEDYNKEDVLELYNDTNNAKGSGDKKESNDDKDNDDDSNAFYSEIKDVVSRHFGSSRSIVKRTKYLQSDIDDDSSGLSNESDERIDIYLRLKGKEGFNGKEKLIESDNSRAECNKVLSAYEIHRHLEHCGTQPSDCKVVATKHTSINKVADELSFDYGNSIDTVADSNEFDSPQSRTGFYSPCFVTECWTSPTELTGVTIPDEFTGEEVFATQLNEDEYPGLGTKKNKTTKSRASSKVGADGDTEDGSQQDDTESSADRSSQASGSVHSRKHRKNKKDFIKRNKQLAADAANMIAMTEEEKKRLDDLLTDVDAIPEIPDAPGVLDESNPFQLAVQPGEGFVPDDDELRSLTSIDSRLKDLLPPDDYASIASSSALSHAPKHKLFTHTGVKHAVDWERRGERALFQNAEQRELNDRMAAIESELAKLKNPEEIELDTPRLGDDQLQDLIDQCVTSLSRASCSRMTLQSDSQTSFADSESVMSHATTIDNIPSSPRSARQEIMENPPKLAPEVLQKLLSEAYHPLSKQLSTLREEDNEEEEGTPIPADVWKLISMEKVDENGVSDDSVNFDGHRVDVSSELQSARNGYRALSRASTSSSLVTVSDVGRESRESQVVKLPEIDPTGTLVTQGPNTQQYTNNMRPDSSESCRTPVNFVRNNLTDSKNSNIHSDSRMEIMSLDGELMSPHPPPAKEKREGSMVKSRTVTPASRVNVT